MIQYFVYAIGSAGILVVAGMALCLGWKVMEAVIDS